MATNDRQWCDRCLEDFPLAGDGDPIQLGKLFPLSRFGGRSKEDQAVRRACRGDHSQFVCGNCVFDVSDNETGGLYS